MLRALMRKFGASGKGEPVVFPDPAPETPFVAIGDIHGRIDLLERLLERIGAGPEPLIFVGDYVDRGEESAQVLSRLHGLEAAAGRPVVCLRGNHEAMLLDFVEDPERSGRRWLRNGGLQTLASYRVGGLSEASSGADLETGRDAFVAAIGQELLDWLAALPAQWRSGNIAVVHAAADPALPLEAQEEKTLLWGCREFAETPRRDGLWIVHGHTIVEAPRMSEGRISIDTGAYATGRLSALDMRGGAPEFIST